VAGDGPESNEIDSNADEDEPLELHDAVVQEVQE
jgi:hypothetical protein